jgi:hypothetical protein
MVAKFHIRSPTRAGPDSADGFSRFPYCSGPLHDRSVEPHEHQKPEDDPPPVTPTTMLIAEARALRRRAAKAKAELRGQLSVSKRLRELLERRRRLDTNA